jgi:hypothetical protein
MAGLKQKVEGAVAARAKEGNNDYICDTAIPVGLDVGKRVEIEFWCAECQHYIYLKLNTQLQGNHVVICPKCQHKHYRLVENGIITSDRYHEDRAIADEIIPMPSAAVPKDQRRVRGEIAVLREMEALGILK